MKKYSLLFLFLAGAIISCKQDPLKINVSQIEVNLPIDRFEDDLFKADPSGIRDSVRNWKKKYGSFLQYFSYIVKLGSVEDSAFAGRLTLFATDHNNYRIYKRTVEVFPNLDSIRMDFEGAYKHYRYYFPGKQIPRIITYVSGLNQSAIAGDSLIAMGLDKYLGSNEPLYREAGIYKYLLVNMHPKKLVSDCISFWGETEFPYNDSINDLASNMIYRGKMMYFTRAMRPDQPDTINFGFSAKNLEYCSVNEKAMWTTLIEKKYLFNTDRFTIDKFILEGPYTKDFGRESPARAAVWIGYRIVSAYMNKNPDFTISDLMEERNYIKILNLSSYNP